jgi:hypothetical protein
MPTQVQFRRGSTSQNNSFTGAAGEISVDTQLNTLRVHDGSTSGGTALVTVSATQTLTNKTLTSPTLTSPSLGVATATSINKVAFTTPASSATLTIADGKTLTASNTLTFTGTDSSSVDFGTGGTVLYSGGALGTPSSATLTNATGLPVSGITASTSTAIGVGSIELGHATDTTIARSSAGVISVEGVVVPTVSSTDTLTNKTIAAGSNTISGLTNSNLSGTAGITNANLANSSITVGTTAISLGASSTTIAGLTSIDATSGATSFFATPTAPALFAAGTAVTIGATTGTTTVRNGLVVTGDLTVNGTTTTVNSTTITVDDINIELGSTASPTDVTAAGGGITLKGTTDKTITWGATNGWTSTEDLNVASGKIYRIDGTSVLSATTLGSGVTGSALTSVGTIGTGVWQGTLIGATYGGTGVNNGSNTLTLAGNVSHAGAFTQTFTATGTTSVTLPTSGTLATLAGSETLTNKTIAAGSNTISGLTNSNLSGTAGISNANLANSSVTIGSTSISLGATSTSLAGITSITYAGSTSGTTEILSGAIAGTSILTLPVATDTLVGKATTDTLTNKSLTSPVVTGTQNNNSIVYETTFSQGSITTQTAVHSFAVATYRSASYLFQITNGTFYKVAKVLVVHDGTTATQSDPYIDDVEISTGTQNTTYTFDISGGNVRLLVTATSGTATVKGMVSMIVV